MTNNINQGLDAMMRVAVYPAAISIGAVIVLGALLRLVFAGKCKNNKDFVIRLFGGIIIVGLIAFAALFFVLHFTSFN